MEAFSLLKYWRGGGGGGGGGGVGSGGVSCGGDSGVNSKHTSNTTTTTIVTALTHHAVETDDDDDDDGPFFDLEFAVPDEEEGESDDKEGSGDVNASDSSDNEVDFVNSDDDDDADGDGEEEGEFKFTLSSGSSNDRNDPNLALSPSDDLFFKGRLVPIESSSLEPNSKTQLPALLLKSATKFRVFMLGFKKSKANPGEKTSEKEETNTTNASAAASATPKQPKKHGSEKEVDDNKQSKFFTVKFKVEEVPIVSLFTRENSKNNKLSSPKENATQESSTPDDKKFSKEVMQKYLNKVKPLYIRVSKRYGEKLRFSGQLGLVSGLKTPPTAATQKSTPPIPTTATEKSQQETTESAAATGGNVKGLKQGNLPAGLRVVCKHLGKSRSASSAVAAAADSPAPAISRRRDDSLLQQQDGIQSAILHCKRSFNASRDSESSLLPRSVSDPSHEKSMELSRKPSEEMKDSCL